MNASERFNTLIFHLGKRLSSENFDARLGVLPEAEDCVKIESKLKAAVELLCEHSPLRLAYLERDLPRILFFVAPGALASCLRGARMCLVDTEYAKAEKTTPASLALTLIHEGMHARLFRAGFTYTDATRARIERVCMAAEFLVARRLGADAQLRTLRWAIDAPDARYSRAARKIAKLRQLAKLGWSGRVGAVLLRPIVWLLSLGETKE